MKKTYKTPISRKILIDTTSLLAGTVSIKRFAPQEASKVEPCKYIEDEDNVW